MCVHGWLGRLGSRQVQSSQCNDFPCEGSPCVASRRSSGRCWRDSRAEARLGLHLGITSQAGPEGRAGLPSPPGMQQRTLTNGAAVSAARQAFSSCLLGRTPFQEAQPMLSCPANLMHLSLRQVPAPWHQTGPLGTRSLPFLSAHPIVHIHVPLGPWPKCWLEGSGRRAQPLRGRGSSARLASLPQADGSLQGPP